MHVRNALWRPRFIMYYLTLLLPEAMHLLEKHGFHVAVHHDAFTGPYRVLKVVIGTKHS